MGNLRKILSSMRNMSFMQIRTFRADLPQPEEEGIQYHGFTYYPRRPDFKDPPYEPTKLFLVRRIKRMSGLNPEERKIMQNLNIDGNAKHDQHVSIVKNIPEINEKLWKVKHLVKITPIKFVNGLPKDGDFRGTYLRDNGEFIVSKKVYIQPERIEAFEKFNGSKNKFDGATMRNHLKLRWECSYTGDV